MHTLLAWDLLYYHQDAIHCHGNGVQVNMQVKSICLNRTCLRHLQVIIRQFQKQDNSLHILLAQVNVCELKSPLVMVFILHAVCQNIIIGQLPGCDYCVLKSKRVYTCMSHIHTLKKIVVPSKYFRQTDCLATNSFTHLFRTAFPSTSHHRCKCQELCSSLHSDRIWYKMLNRP